MILFENNINVPSRAETDVVSCRVPLELKIKITELAKRENVPVSVVIKAFIEETVRRNDPYWWDRSKRAGKRPSAEAEAPAAVEAAQ